MKPPKSRDGAREQIVLKICKPIFGPPTHYMTSSWVSKWSSINCAWTDGARFLIPEVLPVLFKNAFFNISPSAKRICFVIKIDQSQQTIAQNDQWNLRIISTEKIWVWGQITNFGSFRVKFRSSLKVGKSYIKITLLTSAFQKKGWRGHSRSPEIKHFKNRSNFYFLWNKVNNISKWRPWRQLFNKSSREVDRGHKFQIVGKIYPKK